MRGLFIYCCLPLNNYQQYIGFPFWGPFSWTGLYCAVGNLHASSLLSLSVYYQVRTARRPCGQKVCTSCSVWQFSIVGVIIWSSCICKYPIVKAESTQVEIRQVAGYHDWVAACLTATAEGVMRKRNKKENAVHYMRQKGT